jgi:hypothetical protein
MNSWPTTSPRWPTIAVAVASSWLRTPRRRWRRSWSGGRWRREQGGYRRHGSAGERSAGYRGRADSAGESARRSCTHLGPDCFSFPVQAVLRSGCYLTHDHGTYRRTSPFDGRGTEAGPRLAPALELLASVLCRPEPTLVIVGFGRRDAPFDDQLPVVLGRYELDGRRSEAPGLRSQSSTTSTRFSTYRMDSRSV